MKELIQNQYFLSNLIVLVNLTRGLFNYYHRVILEYHKQPTKRKFLGYSFYYVKGEIRFRVHNKSYERLKEKIKITNRIKKLNEIIVGWVDYFKLADMKNKLRDLDQWIRRRLRACIWKIWKLARTRFKNLMKLGVLRHKVLEYANIRKGYWKISKSPVLNKTKTNQRLINYDLKTLSYLHSIMSFDCINNC